jgi:hypothetical protein
VAANVTVVPATAGFLAFRRADEAPGNTSTINFPAGVNRANNAVLPLGTGGDVAVFCGIPSGNVELILDIVGYFD